MTLGVNQDLEQKLYDSVITITKEAGQLVKNRLGSIKEIEQKKNDSDLVTEVDKLSEEFINRKIKEAFPDHWLLSEEDCGQDNPYQAFQNKSDGYGWIIDPIDGTTNFIHRLPHFSVSIGIVKEGEPVIGVVFNPLTGDLYSARKSFGAFCNGQLIRVGDQKQLSEAVVATGFHASDFKPGSRLLEQMNKLVGNTRNIRMLGASSLDLCLIATGKLTGFWHEGLSPWDTAAGMLVLQEAGGKVTNKEGHPYQLFHDSLIASNGHIHSEFLKSITR